MTAKAQAIARIHNGQFTGTIKGMYGKFCEVKLEDGKTRVIPATELEKIK